MGFPDQWKIMASPFKASKRDFQDLNYLNTSKKNNCLTVQGPYTIFHYFKALKTCFQNFFEDF